MSRHSMPHVLWPAPPSPGAPLSHRARTTFAACGRRRPSTSPLMFSARPASPETQTSCAAPTAPKPRSSCTGSTARSVAKAKAEAQLVPSSVTKVCHAAFLRSRDPTSPRSFTRIRMESPARSPCVLDEDVCCRASCSLHLLPPTGSSPLPHGAGALRHGAGHCWPEPRAGPTRQQRAATRAELVRSGSRRAAAQSQGRQGASPRRASRAALKNSASLFASVLAPAPQQKAAAAAAAAAATAAAPGRSASGQTEEKRKEGDGLALTSFSRVHPVGHRPPMSRADVRQLPPLPGPGAPTQRWPNILFFVQPDGALSFFRIHHLNAAPR